MNSAGSNKPLILVLSALFVLLAGSALWLVRGTTLPAEQRTDPSILAVAPLQGSRVTRGVEISILFDQEMDRASVERALEPRPAFEYEARWVQDDGADRLVIEPIGRLDEETNYEITIGGDAANRFGRTLGEAQTLRFTTGRETAVASVQPTPGAASVATGEPITIRFEDPLVEVTSLEDQSNLPAPLLVEPAVSGEGRWIDAQTYAFYPDHPLLPGIQYQVSVSSIVAPGIELADAFRWQFSTGGPALRAVYPFDGARQVGRATAIRMLFDQPMERETVENNFLLRPAGSDRPVAGVFRWEDDRTLIFVPRETLEVATEYEVGLQEEARAEGGGPLGAPVRTLFATVDHLAVTSVQPAAGSGEVSVAITDTLIAVQFNHPVVPLVGRADQASLPNPLQIEPAVEGEGSWVTTSLFHFRLTEPLLPSTAYRVRVDPDLQDTLDSFQQEPYAWTFTTEFPRVVRVAPANPGRLVAAAGPVGVRFNQSVDRESAAAAFTLSGTNGEPIPGQVSWAEQNRELRFVPDSPLTPGERYTIQVAAGVRGARGGESAAPYEATVVVAPPLRVTSFEPARDDEEVSPWPAIFFQMNNPLPGEGLERYVRIEPDLGQIYAYYDPDQRRLTVSTSKGFEPSSPYTLTLAANLTDVTGQRLGEPLVIPFTTGPLPAEIYVLGQNWVGSYDPEAPVLYVAHRNVSRLEFALWEIPAETMVRMSMEQNWDAFRALNPGEAALVQRWQADLSGPLNDYEFYEAPLPLDPAADGTVYLLRVSTPAQPDAAERRGPSAQFVLLTRTHLSLKQSTDGAMAWATDIESGRPVGGREVEFYDSAGVLLGRATTDEDGLASIALDPERLFDLDNTQIGALVRDDRGRMDGYVTSWTENGFHAGYFDIERNLQAVTLFGTILTDRPIYRPGDTVHIWGALRRRDGKQLVLPDLETLRLRARTGDGEDLIDQPLTLSPFGTFAAEIVLDDEIEPGFFSIWADQQEIGGCRPSYCFYEQIYGAFQVAEYVPPPYEVTVDWDRTAVTAGEPATATVSAEFFSGGPVSGAEVIWSLVQQEDDFQVAGLSGYWTWGDQDRFINRFLDPFFPSLDVANGRGRLDESGRLELPFDSLDGDAAGGRGRRILQVQVEDDAGTSVAANGEVILHPGDFYLGISPERFVLSAGESVDLTLAAANLDGTLRGGVQMEVSLSAREWSTERTENAFGGEAWRSIYTDTLVATEEVRTGPDGRVQVKFDLESGGSYVVHAVATDDAGRRIESRTYLWVLEPGTLITWGRTEDVRIDLVADRELYEVGDVARILIPAPVEDATVLITREGYSIESAEVRTLDGRTGELLIPITDEMVPNTFVSVLGVHGRDEAYPNGRYFVGMVELRLSTRSRVIDLEIIPTSDGPDESFGPGQTVTVTLRATGPDGEPVRATLAVAMVDKAVLSLSDYEPTSLLDAFFSRRPLAVETGMAFVSGIEWIRDRFRPDMQGGGGGGGFAPFATLREDFRDTAFWSGDLVTNRQGEASFTVTLPDNLTTWVITADAIAEEGPLVGHRRSELRSSRPLIVRPNLPRFLVTGDEARLQVTLHNNTDVAREVLTTATLEGLERLGTSGAIRTTIPAQSQVVVEIPVRALGAGTARLTIQSEGDGLADGVSHTLPVYAPLAPEVVASAGVIRAGDGAAVESIQLLEAADPEQGSLTIEVASSLAGAVHGTLDWLLTFPGSSHESLASTLLAHEAARRELAALPEESSAGPEEPHRLTTESELLIDGQNQDGGWGWYPSNSSQPWLSAYVTLALHEAAAGDYEVPDETMEEATAYLRRWLSSRGQSQDDRTLATQAFVLYVLSEIGAGDEARAVALFDQHPFLDDEGRAFLLLALDNAPGDQRARVQTLASELTARAILSATGARWRSNETDRDTMNSALRSSAVVLRALVRVQPEHMLLPQSVRWLVQGRKLSHWQTTMESAWGILALTDYMIATGERAGAYDFEVALNDRVILAGQADEIERAPERIEIEMAALQQEEPNELIVTRDGTTAPGRLYYFAWLQSFLPLDQVGPRVEGLAVERRYESVDQGTLTPLGSEVTQVEVGDVVLVRLTVQAPNDLFFLTMEDPIPAGFEILDPSLATTPQRLVPFINRSTESLRERSLYWYEGWSAQVIRDEKMIWTSSRLPQGQYEMAYFLRATVPGRYTALPATGFEQYQPERFGQSEPTPIEVRMGR